MALPVYLVHWNAPEWVRSACASVLASDINVRVTVVNNGPQGISLDLDHRVRVVDCARNGGYSAGANEGVREWLEGDEPFCLVAAHDLHVDGSTLRRLVEVAQAHTSAGVVAPDLGEQPGKGELLEVNDDVEVRTWASGTALLLRRECIEEIGGFDEDFGSYVEDRELGLRATDAGWQVIRVLGATASGLGSRTENRLRMISANHILLAWKRRGMRGLLRRSGATVWAAMRAAPSDRRSSSQLFGGVWDGLKKVLASARKDET